MRRYWCSCGAATEAEVVFRNGAYEAEFFDPADRTPIEACLGCDEDLYPMLCEGTLSETPPDRRPRLRLASSR
jgi:hypothetical protein